MGPRSEKYLTNAASRLPLLAIYAMSRLDATPETNTTDGLFEDVKDIVDLRLEKTSRSSSEQLDESTTRQMCDLVHSHEHHD